MKNTKCSKEELEKYYLKENKSRKEIAQIFNVSEATIKLYLKQYGIKKNRKLITQCQLRERKRKYGTLSYTNKEKFKKTCLEKYGVEYPLQNKQILEKVKQTNLKRYGTIIPSQLSQFKEKSKQTKLERYGDEYYTNIEKSKQTKLERYGDEYYTNRDKFFETMMKKYNTTSFCNIEKSKQTKLERYGDEYYFDKEKMKKTNLEKYGVECSLQNENVRNKCLQTKLERYGDKNYHNIEKMKKTNLEKYGVEFYTQTDEYKNYMNNTSIRKNQLLKIHKTKLKNKSFNSSNDEEEIYKLLCEKYGEVKQQYRSELFPYNCDFYIPSIDMYIDYNGIWTHGNEPYDCNNQHHQEILQRWQLKESKYYKNAIYVWTDLDVRKRIISTKNNIKRKEFFSMEEFLEWLMV